MANYYDSNKATIANSKGFLIGDQEQHFPSEGLYLGDLTSGNTTLPALYDLSCGKGLCFLYNNEHLQRQANACLERLACRIALTVPSHICDLVIYNGGDPSDAFMAHSRMNKHIMGNRNERIFFDGNLDAFMELLNKTYASVIERMSCIRLAGKRDLVELNESLGDDARLKYQFFILADFPGFMNMEAINRLTQIIEVGNMAGVFVLMSFDMKAHIVDASSLTTFNPQRLLSNMQVLVPQGNSFAFRNSGHDDVINRFNYVPDSAPMSMDEINYCLQQIDTYVEAAKKKVKPSILKQNFESLENAEYEPCMSEISVTVGLDIHDKHQVTLRFNSGDYIHGFILGQSGSGKSVLLNNIITSAILKYSPQDLMLYLMDFKGVEFNRYKGLKHTKAVLVDNSDSQMTLEVLRELKEENKRRVKLWQKECVSNIDGYNKKYPNNRLPQILFVADECQVMFKEATNGVERLISLEISEILNIIATQGRSQGIHMLLATQQLDETNISGQVLKNLTECFLLMSAPSDSDRLVPDSSDLTSKQKTGLACYYHKKELQSQVQTYFASNEELENAISAAQKKAESLPGNGEHYFCGSSLFYLDQDKEAIVHSGYDYPVALAGRNIGINAGVTTIPLRKDFMEHILFWGANKEEQTTGVLINSFISLILSYQAQGMSADFVVVDCLPATGSRYKRVLAELEAKGLCRLVERQSSGRLLKSLVDDIKMDFVTPTVLAIIGSERFIEMKRKMPLEQNSSSVIEDDGIIGFDMGSLDIMSDSQEVNTNNMTYPQALMYILEEGPMHGIHVLLQVDKPSNILFGDEYDVEAAMKFRHKIILKSENKHLNPFRFSQDIDVERLSDEEERMRAYYYPDGDNPQLFTPFQMPDSDVI